MVNSLFTPACNAALSVPEGMQTPCTHCLALGGPSDLHERELGQGFEARYVALGLLGEARPLLLDFLEVPRFCEP